MINFRGRNEELYWVFACVNCIASIGFYCLFSLPYHSLFSASAYNKINELIENLIHLKTR